MTATETAPTTPAAAQPLPHAREERLHALDNLRAVAMFLGIVLHAALSFMTIPIPWAAHDVGQHWTFDVMVGFIHGFRMQLFFFIAGFFGRMLHERLGAKEFARQRFKRIGVPFIAGWPLFVLPTLVLFVWGLQQTGQDLPAPSHPRSGLDAIPTSHLWFLQYLLVLYAFAILALRFAGRLSAGTCATLDHAFDRLLQSPLRVLPFIPLTVACLWNGPMLGEVEDAGLGFFPSFSGLLYYALFFGVGWWLHRRRHQLSQLSRFVKTGFLLSFCAMVTHGVILGSQPSPDNSNYFLLKTVSLTSVALYAWLMTFAVTGWFLRFVGQHKAWMRYLADASYWCYLAHMPLVIYLQIVMADWPMNGWLKFILLNAITMLALLATYQTCVRYSFIGTILNGPRQRNG